MKLCLECTARDVYYCRHYTGFLTLSVAFPLLFEIFIVLFAVGWDADL